MTTASATLTLRHEAELAASGIHPEVIAQRNYRSVIDQAELIKLGYAPYQARVPALLLPSRNAAGENGRYQLKPDTPRTDEDGKVIKYETPAGAKMWLDVPAAVLPMIDDARVDLWITEGLKKTDAAVSAGLACIGLLGVWNWRVLHEWALFTLKDRNVFIAFDSDLVEKKEVRQALAALAAFLTSLGARVRIVRLPSGPDGGKVGIDDYLVAGHTADDLKALAGPIVRLPLLQEDEEEPTKVERLETALEDANRRFRDLLALDRNRDCKAQRSTFKAVAVKLDAAYQGGWAEDGGWVLTSRGEIGTNAGVSVDTAGEHMETMARDKKIEKKMLPPESGIGPPRMWIRALDQAGRPSTADLWRSGADWKPSPNPNKPHQTSWGGKRTPCPGCGSTNRKTIEVCANCGLICEEAPAQERQDDALGELDSEPTVEASERQKDDDWSARYREALSDSARERQDDAQRTDGQERQDDVLGIWPDDDEAPPDEEDDPFAWEPSPPLQPTLHGTERCPECRAPLKRDGSCGWASAHAVRAPS